MKKLILAAILGMVILVAAADGQDPAITMRLYNRAGVPQETLFKAVGEAQRIFAETGAKARMVGLSGDRGERKWRSGLSGKVATYGSRAANLARLELALRRQRIGILTAIR